MGRPATPYRSSSSYYRNLGTYHNRSNLTPDRPYTGATGADILAEATTAGGFATGLMVGGIMLLSGVAILGAKWLCDKMVER